MLLSRPLILYEYILTHMYIHFAYMSVNNAFYTVSNELSDYKMEGSVDVCVTVRNVIPTFNLNLHNYLLYNPFSYRSWI